MCVFFQKREFSGIRFLLPGSSWFAKYIVVVIKGNFADWFGNRAM